MSTYKGYIGSIEDGGETWHGHLLRIDDLVSYQAGTLLELNLAFRSAVDDYLATCRALGRKPQRPRLSRNAREGWFYGKWGTKRCRTWHKEARGGKR